MNAATQEAIGAVIGLIVGGVLLTAWNWLEDRPRRRYYRAYWDAELARSHSLAEREAWIRNPANPISNEHRLALLLELHREA